MQSPGKVSLRATPEWKGMKELVMKISGRNIPGTVNMPSVFRKELGGYMAGVIEVGN